MRMMMMLVATTVGGGLGWWVGALMGIYPAVILSAVGTGVSLFYARRVIDEYLPC